MVWFQCEDCGDNLKKPKLPNHFFSCSASKLSCIDCGETFGRQSVLGHTQCITEAEKYGPKGQAKVSNGATAKPNKDKPRPDVDINVGLSDRPPWFCSLCNTSATSKQTLLLHADGKKHRAKARAYAAKQQTKPSEELAPTNKDSTENTLNHELGNEKPSDVKNENGASGHENSLAENGNASVKKRKTDAPNDDGSTEKCANGSNTGKTSQEKIEDIPKKVKKAKCEEGSGQKIKWKKMITLALKSTPDRVLKMKKLKKLVLKSLQESGVRVDDTEFSTTLEHKVNSSTKFTVDGKYVRLAA